MNALLFSLILAVASSGCNFAETPDSDTGRDNGTPSSEPGRVAHSEPSAPVARVRFSSSLAEAKEGAFVDTFRLLAQRDIATRFEVPAELLGTDTVLLHFELRNPEGIAHASKWYAVTMRADAPNTISHPTFGWDVPVQRAEVQAGLASFYGKIPIAGTNFTRSRLHGTFTGMLRLGAAAVAPIAEHSFLMEL